MFRHWLSGPPMILKPHGAGIGGRHPVAGRSLREILCLTDEAMLDPVGATGAGGAGLEWIGGIGLFHNDALEDGFGHVCVDECEVFASGMEGEVCGDFIGDD